MKGLFIDYEYCTGCKSCVVACKMEKALPQEKYGIVVTEIGPWPIDDTHHWQYAYIPTPTDICDLCADRVAKGKEPTCVKHCQAAVMKYGEIDELAKEMTNKTKVVLYTVAEQHFID